MGNFKNNSNMNNKKENKNSKHSNYSKNKTTNTEKKLIEYYGVVGRSKRIIKGNSAQKGFSIFYNEKKEIFCHPLCNLVENEKVKFIIKKDKKERDYADIIKGLDVNNSSISEIYTGYYKKSKKDGKNFVLYNIDKEIFFFNDNIDGIEKLRIGDRVKFEKAKNDEGEFATNIKYLPTTQKSKHTKVKAAGVKSVFAVGNNDTKDDYVADNVLITSFGHGNSAIVEYTGGFKEDSKPKTTNFNLEENNNKIKIIKETKKEDVKVVLEGLADNPTKVSNIAIGETQIAFKSILEKHFFGKTFNDNIHIQIIHNILDVKKILAVHSNNIIYSLDNLTGNTIKDFIGFNGFSVTENFDGVYKKKIENYKAFSNFLKNDKLKYFENAFYTTDGNLRSEEEIYYILALLNETRLVTTHYTEESNDVRRNANIFNLGKRLEKNPTAKNILGTLYKEKIDLFNAENFVERYWDTDLKILFSLFSSKNEMKIKNRIIQYYKFLVSEPYKNLGVSVTRLRECLIDEIKTAKSVDLRNEKYDEVRSDMYKFLDFLIWIKLSNDSGNNLREMISELRSKTKAKEKKVVYKNKATELYTNLYNQQIDSLIKIFDKILGSEVLETNFYEEEKSFCIECLKEHQLGTEVTSFSKLIYLLTIFLDGKEINDLLTTIIEKFDNIASLLDVLLKQKSSQKIKFIEDVYSFFDTDNFISKKDTDEQKDYFCKIVEELRDINAFARMCKVTSLPESALQDAQKLVGSQGNDEFLKNNVINSKWFNYIVRYTDVQTIKNAARNEAIVKFVLNKLPNEQLNRYYESCVSIENNEKNTANSIVAKKTKKVAYLSNKIKEVAEEKVSCTQTNLALVTLYLTVLYQIAKNLVYVNSRYVMAFHSLERDAKMWSSNPGYDIGKDYLVLVNEKISSDKEKIECEYNKKYAKLEQIKADYGTEYSQKYEARIKEEKNRKQDNIRYIEENKEKTDASLIREFRNSVAHLNAIRCMHGVDDIKNVNSYFQMYHCLMQHSFLELYTENKLKSVYPYISIEEQKFYYQKKNRCIGESQLNPEMVVYLKAIKNYSNTYCKDLVKALCVPFAYNLPRFKNLSIEEYFDMHELRKPKNTLIKMGLEERLID